MTATVKKTLTKDQQALVDKKPKINYLKKYPYWVYIVLAIALAGLVVAIVTTGLVSHIYWKYSNYYFSLPKNTIKELGLGPNDFWKLILIDPKYFINSTYHGIPGKTLWEQFENYCKNNNYSPFMEEEQFNKFAKFYSKSTAKGFWDPNAGTYYITTCVFWIISMIPLTIIFINWWAYIVKQIKANQPSKAEKKAAKKAKKEAALAQKARKEKMKMLKQQQLMKQQNIESKEE